MSLQALKFLKDFKQNIKINQNLPIIKMLTQIHIYIEVSRGYMTDFDGRFLSGGSQQVNPCKRISDTQYYDNTFQTLLLSLSICMI